MGYNPFSLDGKTILITGASSGIGRAAAIECSKMSAKLIITARNAERLQETLSQLEGEGHQMLLCDLSDSSAINEMVDQLPEINALVNNAGYTKLLPINFINRDDFQSILDVNTVAPIMLLQRLLKKKKLAKNSSVVFTSSMAGIGSSSVANGMYTASKGALSAFIRCAALELASKGIRVNAVCPAMVNTNIMESGSVSEEQLKEDLKHYPLGRYGEPNDVAYAMIYLLSDASSWVTGTNMVIDGGVTLK